MSFDFAAAWEKRWAEEFQDAVENSGGVPTSEWRAGGRVSKDKPNKENGDWWKTAGLGFSESFAAWREASANEWSTWISPAGEPAIELELTVWFGSVPVRMFIDWIADVGGDQPCIVDYKTGSSTPGPLQLGIYASAIEKAFGVRPQFGAYFNARKGELGTVHTLERFSIPVLTKLFEDFEKAVQAEIFLPNINPMCGSCDVSRYCHLYGGPDAAGMDPLASLKEPA